MSLAAVAEPFFIPSPATDKWAESALCKGKTDIFFGPPGERPSRRRKRETLARSYCNVCVVQVPCREAGRINRENGLWGGENEEERALSGFAPKATERRSVARAARDARNREMLETEALVVEALLEDAGLAADSGDFVPDEADIVSFDDEAEYAVSA